MSDLEKGRYLLLVNYSFEGWSMERYKTVDELLGAVRDGRTYGNDFILAKELHLMVEEEE